MILSGCVLWVWNQGFGGNMFQSNSGGSGPKFPSSQPGDPSIKNPSPKPCGWMTQDLGLSENMASQESITSSFSNIFSMKFTIFLGIYVYLSISPILVVFSPIQDVPSFSDPLHVRQRSVLRSQNPQRCGRRCWRWRRLWGILPSKIKIHILNYIYSTYTLCMYMILFNIICIINIYKLCTQRFTCFDYNQSGSTHGGSTIKHGCANKPLNTTQASPSTHSCPLQNHGFGPRCCDSVTPSCNAAQFWDMPNQTQSYQRISTFRKSQDSLR